MRWRYGQVAHRKCYGIGSVLEWPRHYARSRKAGHLQDHSEPGVKGDTAQGATKPATLETGAVVNVPLFVNEGESIKVDTRTGQYLERAN